jgi:hypothetical protein
VLVPSVGLRSRPAVLRGATKLRVSRSNGMLGGFICMFGLVLGGTPLSSPPSLFFEVLLCITFVTIAGL